MARLATPAGLPGCSPVTVTDIWVDSPDSLAGGRELWAIPKEPVRLRHGVGHHGAGAPYGLARGAGRPADRHGQVHRRLGARAAGAVPRHHPPDPRPTGTAGPPDRSRPVQAVRARTPALRPRALGLRRRRPARLPAQATAPWRPSASTTSACPSADLHTPSPPSRRGVTSCVPKCQCLARPGVRSCGSVSHARSSHLGVATSHTSARENSALRRESLADKHAGRQVGRGTRGRTVTSGMVASGGRSRTCRIVAATVSGLDPPRRVVGPCPPARAPSPASGSRCGWGRPW